MSEQQTTHDLPDDVKAKFAELEQAKTAAEDQAATALQEVETLKARVAELEQAAESQPEPDPIEKADPEVRKRLDEAEQRAKAAEERVTKMEDARALEEAVKAVNSWTSLPGINTDDFAPVIKKVRMLDAESAKAIEKTLADANQLVAESRAFAELGSDAEGTTDMEQKVRKLAEQRVADGKAKSVAEAESTIWTENPDWYTQHRDEKQGRAG